MHNCWVISEGDGSVLKIQVTTRSSKNSIAGVRGDALSVRITAPPVEGRANREIIKFFSDLLGTRKTDVIIRSGERSRKKTVFVKGISPPMVKSIINQHI